MRYLLIFALLLTTQVYASSIEMEKFDQLKLSELMMSLSVDHKEVKTTAISSPRVGTIFHTRFPKNSDGPVSIECQSTYFDGSRYASFGTCAIAVDINHQQLEKSYDELVIQFKDKELAEAMFKIIPHGIPRREFRSHGKAWGTNSAGMGGHIFHYYLSCSTLECSLKLSNKQLR